jgi:Right handed beta helix region
MESVMKNLIMKMCAALALFFAFAATPAMAQATRTWVSGVGDDANPCSRTAPCKTFAGSISKTAAGGEINCLDPGGFGAVTITKSITISCVAVTGGVLVSGTNGITINAGATDRVVIEGLDIEGLSTGLVGISILSGRDVVVRNTTIRNFKGGNATGIQANNTVNAVRLTVENVHFFNNNYGVRMIGTVNGKALINNSAFVNNSVAGMGANGATNAVSVNGNSVTNSPKSVELLGGATGTTFGNNAFNSSPADPMTLTPLG